MQSELPLDDRRLSPPPPPDKEDPESTKVQDALAPVLKPELSQAEYNRLLPFVKRIDYGLDLIWRDREIKAYIQMKLDKDWKVADAVLDASKRFHLSEDHVYTIWYGKKEKDGSE